MTGELAASVISLASDIVFVVRGDGTIGDVAYVKDDLRIDWNTDWVGRPWLDTVTVESKTKVSELLKAAKSGSPPRWRQINHPVPDGADLPVRYVALPFGKGGQSLVLGQEMRRLAELQQELVRAQQGMEREYMRLRHAETRYRALFQVAAEAVLIVDAGTRRIADANPAAIIMLESTAGELIGKVFPDVLNTTDNSSISGLLAGVRQTGKSASDYVGTGPGNAEKFRVSVSIFRQGSSAHFLVRLSPVDGVGDLPGKRDHSRLLDVIESMPEGFVVTDPDGKILAANSAFLDLAQIPVKERAIGQFIGQWVGKSEFDTKSLLNNMREQGVARMFSTVLRGELGSTEEIEVSGVSVMDTEQPCLGFSIRSVTSRRQEKRANQIPGPRSVEQLTELVGQVSLKELVREATEMIERLSIEAALQLTRDNRASAAELLGVSRQSLYAKLHRYGIGDLPSGTDENHMN